MSSAQQPGGQADQPPAVQASPAGGPAGAAGTAAPAGAAGKPDVYRSPVASVVWWVWVAFALANLIDLAVQGHDHFAAEIAAILVLITGVAYVTAFRPRVLADGAGITIKNPLRDHHVPWGCVRGVDLGDSLQVHCDRPDGGQRSRPLYAWAVYSPRRSRLKAEMRARRSARRSAQQSPSYGRLPAEARAAMTKTDAEHTAAELDRRAARERVAGAAAGRPTASWSLPAIAALALPVLLLIVVSLA